MKLWAAMPLLIALAALTPLAQGETLPDMNVVCPVLPTHDAVPEFHTVCKGKRIYFCCEHCRDEFQANPELYASRISFEEPSLSQRALILVAENMWPITGALLAVLAGLLARRRWVAPAVEGAVPGRLDKLLSFRVPATVPLTILVIILVGTLVCLGNALYLRDLEEDLHYATFLDFGYPPVPKRPDGENRLRSSWYRGNDERSPKLFNYGNYRTATFHVSLRDAQGQELDYGSNVEGEITLRVEIERAPFTADFLFSEDLLGKMFLSRENDKFLGTQGPVEDQVGLTTLSPMQRWEAIFPLGEFSAEEPRLHGIVYVFEEIYRDHPIIPNCKTRGGSRFHYAIRYDLAVADGKLDPASDLYMGALYRTRKLPVWKVPIEEWFSSKPIPELPGANVSDPRLLGIEDYKN